MQKMQELKRVIVHRYIAGSTKLLTFILSAVKIGLRSHMLLNGWSESEVDFDNEKRLKMSFSTHIQCPSSHAITLKHSTSLPSTQLFVMFGGYCSTDSRHSYGYQLSSYSC